MQRPDICMVAVRPLKLWVAAPVRIAYRDPQSVVVHCDRGCVAFWPRCVGQLVPVRTPICTTGNTARDNAARVRNVVVIINPTNVVA
eukprot:SAG31_NODE_135_length_23206_cov_25.707967_12_plen_87_part_00